MAKRQPREGLIAGELYHKSEGSRSGEVIRDVHNLDVRLCKCWNLDSDLFAPDLGIVANRTKMNRLNTTREMAAVLPFCGIALFGSS